jgi:hypothetical protein
MKPSKFVVEIPESLVKESSLFSPDDSSFSRLLNVAEEFKNANMTPMFLFDKQQALLYCVAKETYEKKLH